jgi:hypothetical protein
MAIGEWGMGNGDRQLVIVGLRIDALRIAGWKSAGITNHQSVDRHSPFLNP